MDTKEYNKQYYANNKNKILETMNQKVTCSNCNKEVCKSHLNRHQKTKTCQLAKFKNDESEIDQLKTKIRDLENAIKFINV
jgi:hypothetical protein